MTFTRLLTRHWLITFLMMGVFAAIFGLSSYNLFQVFSANLEFIKDNGWLAIMEGGGRQLLEIILYIYISTLAFVFYKVCEYSLVQKIHAWLNRMG